MIVWRCDRCGVEANARPIVGNEFGYISKGFGSLALKIDGKQDFCETCLSMALTAAAEHRKRQTRSVWDAVKKAIS